MAYMARQLSRIPSAVPTLDSERSLVLRAVKHDNQAFARLYDRFVDKIYRYIYFRVSSTALAEDLTAQVFLKAWSNIGHYRWTKRPFAAWLYRIAHNLTIDHIRTNRATLSIDNLELKDESAQNLDDIVQQHLTAETLQSAIRRLTESQQKVITLKFLEGYNTMEVAHLMHKDAGAVRALQHRALSALHYDLNPLRETELSA